MTTPQWAWELAREFWHEAGPPPAFPRRLRPVLDRAAFLLTVEELRRLSTRVVRDYLTRRGVAWTAGTEDRPLRGCVVAEADAGWIFLDADDPADEKELSLAHELAHYLRHVWQPRRRALAALGPGCLDVLDGLRTPRLEERAGAALRGVRLRPYTHLMSRDGGVVPAEVRALEEEADALALELLAPEDEVEARLPAGAGRDEAEALLRDTFGLPERFAAARAERWFPAPRRTPLTDRLRKVLHSCRSPLAGGEPEGGR